MDVDGDMTIGAASTRDSTGSEWMPDWLARRARLDGHVEALRVDGQSLTYAQLHSHAYSVSTGLLQAGVSKFGRVAVLIQSGRLFALAVHALMRLRTVIVPLNWRLTTSEMVWQVDNVRADWLLYDGGSELEAQEISKRTGIGLLRYEDFIDAMAAKPNLSLSDSLVEEEEQRIQFSQPLAVIYTSGTTGNPKGTILTYGNFWWSAMASALQLGIHKGDQWLVPMPLFHVGGLSVLLRSLIYGTTAVVQKRFEATRVNQTIDEEAITLLSVVPTMLSRMLAERGDTPYPPRLRLVLLGGSSAPRQMLEGCLHLGVPVAQSYGLTEACSQVATLMPEDGLRKLGSSGKPLFPTQLKIVSLDRKDDPPLRTVLAAGEVGEIVLRGPTLTQGYLGLAEVNAQRFVDGWFHTGDVGYLDDEGYLYVVDRRNDLIVSGGENIYPAEIESILLTYPGILEAGVVGVADASWGQIPVAVIRVDHETAISSTDIAQYCREHLAGYKVPKQFQQTDSPLPRNASGKLLRRDLKIWVTK